MILIMVVRLAGASILTTYLTVPRSWTLLTMASGRSKTRPDNSSQAALASSASQTYVISLLVAKGIPETVVRLLTYLQIPYAVTKSEIEHFLGKNASMIAHNEQGCSIHIIMERPTSKTMDCYVELMTHDAAVDAFQKHENLVMSGKHPRVGTRHVDVLISSQDELLKAIFPRARGLVWESGVPHKTENHDPYSAGFQGFFTREEMIGMYRHAETPQRVSTGSTRNLKIDFC